MSLVKQFFLLKSSGFFNNITISDFNGIRTIEIVDKEVLMTDKKPSDTIFITFNKEDQTYDNDGQLVNFAKTILDIIGENESIDFAKWLFQIENGKTPCDCVINKNKTVEELYKLWKDTVK